MIFDFLERKVAQAAVAEERMPGIDRFSRRALGLLAGAVMFAGLSNTVRADGCTSRCGDVCPGTGIPCLSCGGSQCWEGFPDGMCCDYQCDMEMPPGQVLCCSEEEGMACD